MTTALDFLAAVLPEPEAGETIELRAKNAGSGAIFQGFETSIDQVVATAQELRNTHHVWYGPCLRTARIGDAEHATRTGSLWSDVDFKCFGDGQQGASNALRTFPVQPSAIIHSGHGLQPYWFLQEPSDREDKARVRCILRGIQDAISSQAVRRLDSVNDVSRVMRMPDTLNLKDPTPLPVRIVAFNPERRYDLRDFIDAGIWEDEPEPGAADTHYEAFKGDAEEALRRAIRAGLPSWVVGALEEPAAHTRTSLSELDYAVLRQLLRVGLSTSEVEAVWIASNLGDTEHSSGTRKTREREDYRRRTIARALAAEGRSAEPDAQAGQSAATGFTFRTARQIATSAPAAVPWIVPGYVARGAMTELDSQPKGGKTTMLLALCRAVLDGRPFLGLSTRRTNIVYLTEQSDTSFRSALARANLLDEEGVTILSFHQTGGAPWPDVMAAAVAEAKRREAGLLIVDTLGQFSGLQGDAENNSGDALQAIAPLQAAAAVDGLAVIPVRHERKSGGEVGASGRGSSAFAGAADVIMSLRRTGEREGSRRILHALSRFDETPSTLVIELDGAEYRALGNEAAVAFNEAEAAILVALPTSADSAKSLDSILAELEGSGVKRSTAQGALKAMVEDGQVRRIGEGKKGKPYRYWRPADDE